jgi:hypothetical protein
LFSRQFLNFIQRLKNKFPTTNTAAAVAAAAATTPEPSGSRRIYDAYFLLKTSIYGERSAYITNQYL